MMFLVAGTGVIRRQSLARLHSMAIEAPITKVINIISAAQESSPIYISQALDKVINFRHPPFDSVYSTSLIFIETPRF